MSLKMHTLIYFLPKANATETPSLLSTKSKSPLTLGQTGTQELDKCMIAFIQKQN